MMIPLVPVISTPAKKARETGFDQIVQPILDAFEYSGKLPELFSDKAKITVDQVVSHLAYIYEKLRNVIDFKEEKLLRKNALERVLKRRLGMGGTAENISLSLIKELIRAGYIENNTVPEIRIGEIRSIIDKYVRSDEAMINYDLWMRSFPEWKEPTDELLEEFAGHIDEIYNRFETEKNHPLA